MKKFTEAYVRARDVLGKQEFSAEWAAYLRRKCQIEKLFGVKGMSRNAAKAPEMLREKVREKRKEGSATLGDVLYDAASGGTPAGAVNDRAATLKMIHHTYRIVEKGGQDVWVYSPPRGDVGWVFDEILGDTDMIKSRLSREEEIFSEQEMRWMSGSLNVARKISGDVQVKIGGIFGASKRGRELVRHWFLDEKCGDSELKAAMSKLTTGFRKISVACESSTLVFADYPDWRSAREDYYGAAFRGGEGGGFPVVYLEGAFTRLTGNSGKTWLCAETIIHELSHHEMSTQDHRYDEAGLKPDSATFPYAKAIDNADSWGYFALDLAGYLSKADHDRVWR